MFNSKIPHESELPTSRRLLRSTMIALATALAILFLFVLPAEYGYDITGVGRLLRLTQMGEVKLALLKEAKSAPGATAKNPKSTAVTGPEKSGSKRGAQTLVLNPGEAVEVKLEMQKGARVSFSWETTGGSLNFDTHGDPYEDPNGYHRYSKGVMTQRDQGELVAVFGGWHGWFWRNRDKSPVTITVKYEGEFLTAKNVKKS